MFHRFNITLASLILVITLAANSAQGAVSYLLIQGEFNAGSLGEETYKWKVNYNTGELVTSLDLLNAVFGVPSANGTYTDAFSGVYPYLSAGNSTQGAGYFDFGGGSLFLESFTLNSTKVAQDTDYDPSWSSHVAGGFGTNHGGSYPNAGTWTYSDDGITTRQIADNSFDGWVFGASSFNSGNNPLVADFSGATVINYSATPEPSRSLLLLFAGIALMMHRRRSLHPQC